MGCTNSKWDYHQTLEESISRRKSQTLSENIVHEEYEKDISEFYDINRSTILGSGLSGSVRACTHKKSGIVYALKTLDKSKLNSDQLVNLRQEIRIMSLLDHPNILRLQECFETSSKIFLVLELLKGGELLDRLNSQAGHKYSEYVACRYVKTIVGAIRYCHDKGICHRDLKLENFLFETEQEASDFKLIDFGLSQHANPGEILSKAVGTPYYVAPEVLERSYTTACDIWSIGVISYMLLSGKPPFFGSNDAETIRAVKEGRLTFNQKYFHNISAEAQAFVSCCLNRNYEMRPTAEELLSHAWFKRYEVEPSEVTISDGTIGRLKQFQKRSRFGRLVMEVISHSLTSDQIIDLKQEFIRLDEKKEGRISCSALRQVLIDHGSFSEVDIEHLFQDIDVNKSNGIEYHEFIAATISRKEITEANLRVAFDKISNHQNVISSADIQDLLGENQEMDTAESMFREELYSPSSKLDFDQFKKIMKGGDFSPMLSSPLNKHRKRLAFAPSKEFDKVE